MRKIILMAVAGYLWKKFKARQTVAPVAATTAGPFQAAERQRSPRPAKFS